MATVPQLQQFIRFGLESLGERNAHHDFETLSLAVARRRIASNLLPSTGPVSAGGDQGRDAESYFTHLTREVPEASAFARLASDETIVLACTVQRRGIAGKIRKDIAAICSTGTTAHRIAYFTVAPVPVKTRHDLQNEARNGFQVALDIFDSLWLAHELAEPDLFHLAETYLQVPSEFARPPDSADAHPEWYLKARSRWREQEEFTGQLGEFAQLRRALRHATFHAEARADLADWLHWARRMLQAAEPDRVRPRLHYEIAVAHLRGLGDLTPADQLVRDFFDQVLNSSDMGLLQDAQVTAELSPRGLGQTRDRHHGRRARPLDLPAQRAHRQPPERGSRGQPPGRPARPGRASGPADPAGRHARRLPAGSSRGPGGATSALSDTRGHRPS
ncbi:hypothetical protein [Streptomyces apocyni]|uniref:hypothetical protein n=1 Tax=Streptomyces apocyni TaxID=2654677 RepID=UPI0012EAF818|nr:hypothetical protein [Streptomyces apocyni]